MCLQLHDAVLVSSIGNNSVLNLTVISGGSGYSSIPTITIGTPNSAIHFTATGTAVPDSKGNISSITITDGGKYYQNPPTITVGNPPDSVRATATASLSGSAVS